MAASLRVQIAVLIYLLTAASARVGYAQQARPIQLRDFGIDVKLGHSVSADDRQIELLKTLGVSVVN